MNKKIRWITETAVMLALLVCLQALTKPLGQLVTGSCVNAILAISVLAAGFYCGLTVAIISPIMAFLLGIAPNFITVAPIMLGNICYIGFICLLYQPKAIWTHLLSLVVASFGKFAVLYLLVVKVICSVASDALLGKKLGDIVLLAPPMLKILPTMFAWPQLFTALIGGTVALLICPVLRKALRK